MIWPGQMATISKVIFMDKYYLKLEKPSPSDILELQNNFNFEYCLFSLGHGHSHLISQ